MEATQIDITVVAVFDMPRERDRTDIIVWRLQHDTLTRGVTVTRFNVITGLAIFDERVGIGGYDESTGLMQVFVNMDAPIACE